MELVCYLREPIISTCGVCASCLSHSLVRGTWTSVVITRRSLKGGAPDSHSNVSNIMLVTYA